MNCIQHFLFFWLFGPDVQNTSHCSTPALSSDTHLTHLQPITQQLCFLQLAWIGVELCSRCNEAAHWLTWKWTDASSCSLVVLIQCAAAKTNLWEGFDTAGFHSSRPKELSYTQTFSQFESKPDVFLPLGTVRLAGQSTANALWMLHVWVIWSWSASSPAVGWFHCIKKAIWPTELVPIKLPKNGVYCWITFSIAALVAQWLRLWFTDQKLQKDAFCSTGPVSWMFLKGGKKEFHWL